MAKFGLDVYNYVAENEGRYKYNPHDLNPSMPPIAVLQAYWKFDAIESQQVAIKLCDMAFNFGPTGAILATQTAVKTIRDGILGPITTAAINALPVPVILTMLCLTSRDRYLAIIKAQPAKVIYRNDWLGRAAKRP